MKVFGILLLLLPSLLWACHDGVPNCDRPDLGACSNACCMMRYQFSISPQSLMEELLKTTGNGGPDQQYALSTTAEGSYGFADFRGLNFTNPTTGFTDLFLGQAVHTTGPLGVECIFHDYVNFLISEDQNQVTQLTAFSISQVAGALGDHGQNYYNIYTIIENLQHQPTGEVNLLGCPPPGANSSFV
mmetsp:Transcript_29378/g.40569  ORF Transcript_29378/g.40569 Transcript_29378/m.40569 type:complete len:187 (-) Transcript_29378:28-588(-)|eukprot:CAMPEP_0201490276 /NCGR_PEP_ID=MMETSP0151_2-20130828/25889_1 /ASSEMBLY_ACC=CAM_ASM_000257 /TAXON_ID=200890 /ORGANISM="Paramoeba atlantica, Strain 621/1 / CCAP 1560/9" /LENGTH=186 /DNA_ID=CAMNT_0047876177 /DNA_START=91 /DNA_END=651 /DNA_ORIENTATION=-